jgi:hypothetical protein
LRILCVRVGRASRGRRIFPLRINHDQFNRHGAAVLTICARSFST